MRERRLLPNSNLFSQIVICWFTRHSRDFPWRKTHNPYYIFVAEVLLRRTQAPRIIDSYKQITEKYPTPETLSKADVTELRKFFKPLGLIKRADCLIKAAKQIVNDYGGQIPCNLRAVASLPCMGIYSSRAVICMAFDAHVPMIDESSGRVLRRVFQIEPKGPAYSDKKLLDFALSIIPIGHAREFNLGLLDIASFFCHSSKPECLKCPLSKICYYARKT